MKLEKYTHTHTHTHGSPFIAAMHKASLKS